MKVAFITTVSNWWYDRIHIKKGHWMHDTVPSRLFEKDGRKSFLRIDYAVGYLLQHMCKSFAEIHMITPNTLLKMNAKKLSEYDVIINQFLSPLAVFQTYGALASKKYRTLLNRNADKVYPNIKYTEFIEDKCKYIDSLKTFGFPVAETFCLNRQSYMKDKGSASVDRVMTKVKRLGWQSVFAKPILGTGSWGTKVFSPNSRKSMENYLKQLFEKKKYPKVMFQENHPEFGTSFYEIRMVFVGREYQYTVMNDVQGNWKRPKQEGGTVYVPQLRMLKKMSKDIIEKIIEPAAATGSSSNSSQNHLLLETRIDYGCCVGHQNGKYFVNELEYAGGLMTFMDKKNQFDIHIKLAKQLKKVLEY